MRWAVLADIHGNLPALEAVAEDARRQGAEGFWVAGDLLPRAPFVGETLALLRELGALMIRGNVDTYQLEYAADPLSGRFPGLQHSIVRWTHAQLGSAGLEFLRSLPEERTLALPGLPAVRLIHATPGQPRRGLLPDQSPPALDHFRRSGLWEDGGELPPLAEQVGPGVESLLINGHTHIAWQQALGERLVLNPGSVGLPSEGDPGARYALVEWGRAGWQVQPRVVAYDRARLERAYHTSGMLAECGVFAYLFLANAQSGQNIPWFFIRAGVRLKKERAPEADVWGELARTFPWEQFGVPGPG